MRELIIKNEEIRQLEEKYRHNKKNFYSSVFFPIPTDTQGLASTEVAISAEESNFYQSVENFKKNKLFNHNFDRDDFDTFFKAEFEKCRAALIACVKKFSELEVIHKKAFEQNAYALFKDPARQTFVPPSPSLLGQQPTSAFFQPSHSEPQVIPKTNSTDDIAGAVEEDVFKRHDSSSSFDF